MQKQKKYELEAVGIRFRQNLKIKIKLMKQMLIAARLRVKSSDQGDKAYFNRKESKNEIKQRQFFHYADIASILVEDEERVRRFWEEYFLERGMTLYSFSTEKEFLEFYSSIAFPVQFYFDQDFGSERGVGVRLARLVRHSPYRSNTSLITAYYPENFKGELEDGTLDAVMPKYPHQIFGPNYFNTRMRKEIKDRGVEAILDESFHKLTEACIPLAKGISEVHSVRDRCK